MKRYVAEPGSGIVNEAIEEAALSATTIVSRAEVGAALARAVRMGVLSTEDGRAASDRSRADWPALVRVPATSAVVVRADELAWEHELRGYDALQLAAALQWAELLAAPVTIATFDRQLWEAASRAGLDRLPLDLPAFLAELVT